MIEKKSMIGKNCPGRRLAECGRCARFGGAGFTPMLQKLGENCDQGTICLSYRNIGFWRPADGTD